MSGVWRYLLFINTFEQIDTIYIEIDGQIDIQIDRYIGIDGQIDIQIYIDRHMNRNIYMRSGYTHIDGLMIYTLSTSQLSFIRINGKIWISTRLFYLLLQSYATPTPANRTGKDILVCINIVKHREGEELIHGAICICQILIFKFLLLLLPIIILLRNNQQIIKHN